MMGDRNTSDVVVRLRTDEGRDSWFYCHSDVLTQKSKYFADRLSDDWPTCQILDSRNCVDVYCQELAFNFHVIALRLLYVNEPQTWYGVRNTLGILQVAVALGCSQLASACVEYLESVPWEEADEEEILRTIPSFGTQYQDILARLQPVNPVLVVRIFISAIQFATSSLPTSMKELKSSAQEQLEYMLTEDDDSPLLTVNDDFVRTEVKKCMKDLLMRFDSSINSVLSTSSNVELDTNGIQSLHVLLSDISWICQILAKMEMIKELVHYWVEASANIAQAIEMLNSDIGMLETRLKATEVVSKVLEAVSSGNAIIPVEKRLKLVSVWLPFVQKTKPLVEPVDPDSEDTLPLKVDNEIWQSLESAFASIILTLPSSDQAEILAKWFEGDNVRYPDLTEALKYGVIGPRSQRGGFLY